LKTTYKTYIHHENEEMWWESGGCSPWAASLFRGREGVTLPHIFKIKIITPQNLSFRKRYY
jgi:hypothetical protein